MRAESKYKWIAVDHQDKKYDQSLLSLSLSLSVSGIGYISYVIYDVTRCQLALINMATHWPLISGDHTGHIWQ